MRLLVSALAVVLLSGCALGQAEPEMVDTDAVTVAVGEEVRVRLGPDNPSVGWNYYLVDGEDNGHASLAIDRTERRTDVEPGATLGDVYVAVVGETPGEFTFVTQQCLRTRLEECDAREPAREVSVTVVE